MRIGGTLLLLSILMFLVSFTTGCNKRTEYPVYGNTSYVYLNKTLESKVSVVQLVEERNGDLASSQIMLHNNTTKSMTIYVRARYFDAAGREVPSTFSQWNPTIVEGGATRPVTAVAPNTSVIRIQFEINSETKDPEPSPGSKR